MTPTAGKSPTKAQQRRQGRAARAALDPDARHRASVDIARRVVSSPEFLAAAHVACYVSEPDEVDTSEIIARAWQVGKALYAPVIDRRGGMRFLLLDPDTRLERNPFGLWEPVDAPEISPSRLDLVITPVVAFDLNGHRIGMGGGYFDRCFRFLGQRRHWHRPKLVGIAFACQQVEKIQPNPWDISLYKILFG